MILASEKNASKIGTSNLKDRDSTSCLVRIQKSWGVFMRKLFHMSNENDGESLALDSKSKAGMTRSSKSKTIPIPVQKTDTYFRAQTFSSSATLLDEEGFEFDLHLPLSEVANADGFAYEHERNFGFLKLPLQVRETIYNYITPHDILSLRLTCRALKTDVETNHGFIVRMHDGRLDYEKPLQTLGIVKLIVEQFIQEDQSCYLTYLRFPHLLKTITIAGPISQTNLRFLLKIAENLKQLVVSFQSPSQQVQTFNIKQLFLENLKILEISSDSFMTSAENYQLTRSIRDLFANIHFPNISCFNFSIVGVLHENIDEYHELVMSFVLNYRRSLNRVKIQLIQIMGPVMAEINSSSSGNPAWIADWMAENNRLKLEEIDLHMNACMQQWYPVINAQSHLRKLKLDVKGQPWNRLITVLSKVGKTLQTLTVTGLLPFHFNNGVTPEPVDLAPLQNMTALEHLEIEHEEIESRGLIPSSVIRTSYFPPTLKSVKLSHLRLKPYQAMFLFLKLPKVDQIVLNFWTDSEGTLAAFITVLTFLIKFDQTPVGRIEMSDCRRKMENQQDCISKMRNILQNHADIKQTHSELYSTLMIERFYQKQ